MVMEMLYGFASRDAVAQNEKYWHQLLDLKNLAPVIGLEKMQRDREIDNADEEAMRSVEGRHMACGGSIDRSPFPMWKTR